MKILKKHNMKKIYILILACIFTFTVNAQLILTKATTEPVIGDVNTKLGFDSVGVVPKNTGPAQTWSFTAFTSNTVTEVSTFTTVASTPDAASFPSADIAEDDGNSSYNYFEITPSTFELNGISTNGIIITFTNNAIAAQWPIQYLYSNTDTYVGIASAFSQTGTATGTITTTAPGNGVVMLPGGITYTNALQVRSTNTLNATLGSGFTAITVNIGSTDYTYYSGTQKFPVIGITYEKQTLTSGLGSTVTATAKIRINNAVYAGINEFSLDNSYSVYPNPASEQFNVSLDNNKAENVSVEIFNQLGQSVKKENLGNNSNINSIINTSGFTSGVYFVRTSFGNRSSVKKLIIE
jgi:hypothetical protein